MANILKPKNTFVFRPFSSTITVINVRRITTVFFTCLHPISGIRIGQILQRGRIHAVFLIFGNDVPVIILLRLFLDCSFQKLIVLGLRVCSLAFWKKGTGIIYNLLRPICLWDILIMIHDSVPVLRIRVILQAFEQLDFSVPVVFFHQVGGAGVAQVQLSHLPDVGFDHHAVYSLNRGGYLHVFPNGF